MLSVLQDEGRKGIIACKIHMRSFHLPQSIAVYQTQRSRKGLGGWKARAAPQQGPAMRDPACHQSIRAKFIDLMGLGPSETFRDISGRSAPSLLKWKLRGIESELAF